MKIILFALMAVVVAYSLHATADSVSPATGQPTMGPAVRLTSGEWDNRLPLTGVPDPVSHPISFALAADNSKQFKSVTEFLQLTDAEVSQPSSAQTALTLSANWGLVLIGCSALYMITTRRHRSDEL